MNKYSVTKLPSDILSEVAKNHKKARKLHKYSQAELAVRSGVSLGTIKRFENSGQISFEYLLKLAYLLDSLADFESIFKNECDKLEIEKLFNSKNKK